MTWKEFFYPTKKKIIVSLIIISLIELYIFYLGSLTVCFPSECDGCSCPPNNYLRGFIYVLKTLIPVTIFIYSIICFVSYLFRKKE